MMQKLSLSCSSRRTETSSGSGRNVYLENAGNSGSFMWSNVKTSDPHVKTVTVFAKECPMIFPKIVGVLTLNNFDILDVRNYRQNTNSLGTFKVQALPGHSIKEKDFFRAEQALKAVLSGELNLTQAFRHKISRFTRMSFRNGPGNGIHVELDNEKSFLFSVIKVTGDDFPGVLFAISDAIIKSGLDIWNAQIITKNRQISDMFYVKNLNGKKIGKDVLNEVDARLKKILAI